MNEEKIDQLKEALREVMMIIAERNQPLSEDLKVLLVQVMEHVAQRIKELRSQEQEGGPILTPEKPLTPGPFPSSNINAFDYDYETGQLKVKFQGKDVADAGPTYTYEGVPKFIFDIFRRGAVPPKTSGKNKWHTWKKGVMPSLGAAMYHLIRTNYPYQRVA